MMANGILKAAVLIDTYDDGTSMVSSIKDSFTNSIRSASPAAQVDFFDPIKGHIYPDPSKYDLIVLSGGTENPNGKASWVLKVQEFLRSTAETYPSKKIMGICWGHQTICVTFGGVVEGMEKSELGIVPITLTPAGGSFFKASELHLHEFHKRKVTTPAPDFVALAENGQAFVNSSNTIISFQGHPEVNTDLAKKMLKDAPSYMCVDGKDKEAITLEGEHDGSNIWKRVIQWVEEKPNDA